MVNQFYIFRLTSLWKKDKTCAPYVRNYEQSHLFRINVAWLLTLLPYQILLGFWGVFISHVPNFVISPLFQILVKVRLVMVRLRIFPIFSFLAKMLSFLLRNDNIFARNENIGKIRKRTITWTDFKHCS